jgi:hypothetical protein
VKAETITCGPEAQEATDKPKKTISKPKPESCKRKAVPLSAETSASRLVMTAPLPAKSEVLDGRNGNADLRAEVQRRKSLEAIMNKVYLGQTSVETLARRVITIQFRG